MSKSSQKPIKNTHSHNKSPRPVTFVHTKGRQVTYPVGDKSDKKDRES
jgi:hypothetical protein